MANYRFIYGPPLFRFTKRDYALALLSEGKLRLNPPSEFHNEEKHGPKIGDKAEGEKNVTYTNVVAGKESSPAPFKDLVQFKDPKNPLNPTLVVTHAEVNERCDHALIFCFLGQQSIAAVTGFSGDTWVEIRDPHGFCLEVTRSLDPDLQFRGLHSCRYIGRSAEYPTVASKQHPLLVKDPAYAQQKEVRAIWFSRSKTVQKRPLDVFCPKAAAFCKLVEGPNTSI